MANEQENPIRIMRIDAFSGGMNTSSPANEIEDNEAVEILNMEFDDNDNLITRNGVISEVGVVSLWDTAIWDANFWSVLGTTYVKRITSILDFTNESGNIGIIYTTGTKIFSRILDGSSVTDLTGALVLPDDVRWYWKILNGIAVGVNGLTSGDNPIKVIGPAPGTASKLTTAPVAKFIELWNSRLWIVRADFPNQIQASNLGDPSTWDTDGGANPSHGSIFDLNKNDDDLITGIYATKDRLFIFKKNYTLVAFPERADLPVTDLRGLKIETYASNLGCLAATTIRPVLDDVLFLSQAGVASLVAANIVADFESAIVSSKVKDISGIKKDIADEDVFAFVLLDRSQYWLSVAAVSSPTGKDITYVLDFRRIQQKLIRWVIFDGLAFGTSIASYDHDSSNIVYLLGCHDTIANLFFVGRYIPKDTPKIYLDGIRSVRKNILTKAYDFTLFEVRKYYDQWFLGIISNTTLVSLSIAYYFNESSVSAGSYSFVFNSLFGGSLFDIALFDTDIFDKSTQVLNNLIRRSFLQNSNGKKALSVQMAISNNQLSQGYTIKNFGLWYAVLSEFKSQTV